MITTKVLKFIVRDQALSYTKHYHIGSQRVASKIGTSERFGFYSEQIIPLANLANADGINLIDVLQDPDEDGQNFNHLNERRNRILQAFDIPPLESETVDISEDENVTQGSDNFAHGYAGDLQHVEVFYFHSDHLGSSNYVSNYDGDISQHAEYLPFGELLTDEHLNSHNTRYKYNGKEFDQETGNYYYGARYYNPKNSLWLSVDPLAEERPGMTPYNFVQNNPLNRIDPDGALDMEVQQPLDDYKLDKDGNITLIKTTDDNFDTLVDSDDVYVGKVNKGYLSDGLNIEENGLLLDVKDKKDFHSYMKFTLDLSVAVNKEIGGFILDSDKGFDDMYISRYKESQPHKAKGLENFINSDSYSIKNKELSLGGNKYKANSSFHTHPDIMSAGYGSSKPSTGDRNTTKTLQIPGVVLGGWGGIGLIKTDGTYIRWGD
ncbi:RHS repeat-associated core domain-containing protein [Flavobacterium sp. CS20]|nr:RHS repeat-associated core domain-containing protein [Flavobacterium sp. CS20]